MPEKPITSKERMFILHLRAERLRNELQTVAEEGELYLAELGREDRAHRGRLTRRAHSLKQAINRAHDAMHKGPITREEVEEEKSNPWNKWADEE